MTKICPKCNKMNMETAKFCEGCGTTLLASQPVKETKSSSGGVMGWWNSQGSGVKALSIIGVCCVGLILIIGVMALITPDTTTNTTTSTSPSSSTPATDTSSSGSSVTSATAGQEQAAKMAESYLDTMAFSRSGLIEQLEYEGFTSQQAEYGVQAVGL